MALADRTDPLRVAVVGGGVFGGTVAVELARVGCQVDLFERHDDLLLGATRANQGRLHYGYHYPRSPAAAELRAHADRFARRFPDAIVRAGPHYYCIARQDSHLTGAQYLDFCDRLGLPYRCEFPDVVNSGEVSVSILVPEARISVRILRTLLRHDMSRYSVRLRLGAAVQPGELDDYDWVVNATYGRYNRRPLQFEICETALIALDQRMTAMSFVVMDGPFISLDPVPGQHPHMLYDVVNSVHSRNIGYSPEVPGHLAQLLDRGPVRTPLSRVEAMLGTARRFLYGLESARYCGSLFTVRAVLPDVEATDERPTLVERDGRHITILSGKIDMAVWGAEQAVGIIRAAVLAD